MGLKSVSYSFWALHQKRGRFLVETSYVELNRKQVTSKKAELRFNRGDIRKMFMLRAVRHCTGRPERWQCPFLQTHTVRAGL